MAIAGKVAITPKGAWSSTESYEKLDAVTHNNALYIAKKDSVGVEPVDGDTWMFAVTSLDQEQLDQLKAELNSNLDSLGYGENGVYNLLDLSKLLNSNFDIEECNVTNKITDTKTIFNFYVHLYDKDGKIINEAVKTNISSNESKDFTFSLPIGCEKIRLKHNGSSKDIIICDVNIEDIGLKENDTITVHISVSSADPTVVGGIVIKELAIVKGDTFKGYKPYIPSVKMLASENEQQNTEAMDLKMLGWTVPSECPVQNYVDSDGVFHQRVGRVDLGSLTWSKSSNGMLSSGHTEIKSHCNMSCSAYDAGGANTWKEGCIGCEGGVLWVGDTSYTDAATFKSAMQGIYLYYELATEITTSVDGNEAVTKLSKDVTNLYTVPGFYGLLSETTLDLRTESSQLFSLSDSLYLYDLVYAEFKGAGSVAAKSYLYDTLIVRPFNFILPLNNIDIYCNGTKYTLGVSFDSSTNTLKISNYDNVLHLTIMIDGIRINSLQRTGGGEVENPGLS